jgi:hypothetical protein
VTVTIATLGERALRRLGVTIVSVADRPALSATVPVASIATNALLWLAVIASDETPAAEDQALAVAKVSAVHDALVAQAIVSWPSTAIPQAVSEEMTMLAAQHLAPSFGKQIGDAAGAAAIEARIRKVALIMAAPALASDAVLSVHKDFVARGLARWSVFDLPAEVEDPYVYLAANQLAPLFGQKANPMDDAAANQSLFRYIALESSGEPVRADYF